MELGRQSDEGGRQEQEPLSRRTTLAKKRKASSPHVWSQEENDNLEVLWKTSPLTTAQVAERLGKTIGMVAGQARRMGWKRPPLQERIRLQEKRYVAELREEELEFEKLGEWVSAVEQPDLHGPPSKKCTWRLVHTYTNRVCDCGKHGDTNSPFCRRHRMEALARVNRSLPANTE